MQEIKTPEKNPALAPPAPPQSKTTRNCLVGCFGCLGVVGVLVLLIVFGGRYVLLHTSAPLALMESVLESSGEVDIRGLKGTVSTGFHADEIRFGKNPDSDKASYFKNITFRFNGLEELFETKPKLIIEEFTVESGTVYYSPGDIDPRPDRQFRDDLRKPPSRDAAADSSNSTGDEFQEVRIDVVRLTNLKAINRVTGDESELAEFSIKDLHYLEGQFQNAGEYEIKGLTIVLDNMELRDFSGSPSSGFKLDQLRLKNQQDQWSQLEQVVFEFNGMQDLLKNDRLAVKRIAVNSGRFYFGPGQRGDTESGYSMLGGWSEVGGEGLREFSVEDIELPNLVFVNAETGLEFTLKQVSLKDYQSVEGQVTKLGKLQIEADQLAFQSGPSQQFKDLPDDLLKQAFSGVVKTGFAGEVVKDIPFQLDCCFLRNGRVLQHLDSFGGSLACDIRPFATMVRCENWQPLEFLKWDRGLLPSFVSGAWDFKSDPPDRQKDGKKDGKKGGKKDRQKGGKLIVKEALTFGLGTTEWVVPATELSLDPSSKLPIAIPFASKNEEDSAKGQLFLSQHAPFVVVQLESVETDRQEQFAKILHGSPFANLSSLEQLRIKNNLTALDQLPALPQASGADDAATKKEPAATKKDPPAVKPSAAGSK